MAADPGVTGPGAAPEPVCGVSVAVAVESSAAAPGSGWFAGSVLSATSGSLVMIGSSFVPFGPSLLRLIGRPADEPIPPLSSFHPASGPTIPPSDAFCHLPQRSFAELMPNCSFSVSFTTSRMLSLSADHELPPPPSPCRPPSERSPETRPLAPGLMPLSHSFGVGAFSRKLPTFSHHPGSSSPHEPPPPPPLGASNPPPPPHQGSSGFGVALPFSPHMPEMMLGSMGFSVDRFATPPNSSTETCRLGMFATMRPM